MKTTFYHLASEILTDDIIYIVFTCGRDECDLYEAKISIGADILSREVFHDEYDYSRTATATEVEEAIAYGEDEEIIACMRASVENRENRISAIAALNDWAFEEVEVRVKPYDDDRVGIELPKELYSKIEKWLSLID